MRNLTIRREKHFVASLADSDGLTNDDINELENLLKQILKLLVCIFHKAEQDNLLLALRLQVL